PPKGGRGTKEKIPVPPFCRGGAPVPALSARGDLALIVKQPSVTRFELKLTPMGIGQPPLPPPKGGIEQGIQRNN
ncbi:hypothetical protein, partial [Microcoleus anatoxicus]